MNTRMCGRKWPASFAPEKCRLPGCRDPTKPRMHASPRNWRPGLTRLLSPNPTRGVLPVHRLNRAEYTAAVRDLLALDIDGKALLSADDADQEGFDNVASVLSVSPVLLENYLSAARRVSRLAVGDLTLNPAVDTYKFSRAPDTR